MLSGVRFDVTSAEDAKEKNFLLERQGFVESQHFRNVLNGDYRFIVGRKGGGKTAMFFQTGLKASRSGRIVIEMSLTECPPKQFFQQIDKLLERAPDEAMLLRNMWRYTIGISIMHRLRTDQYLSARLPRDPSLRSHHNTICSYLESIDFRRGGIEHEPNIWTVADLLVSRQADVFFEKHLPSEAGKYFPTSAAYVQAEAAMCELLRMRGDDHKGAMILVDDLDKWIEETNYPRMTPFLRGLLEAATDCESISMARGDVRIQTYIPEDLFAKVTYRHEDKLSHIYHLRYHTLALRQMLARRILSQSANNTSLVGSMSDEASLAAIQKIFVLQDGRLPPIAHRWNIGRDAFQYIVSHTLSFDLEIFGC